MAEEPPTERAGSMERAGRLERAATQLEATLRAAHAARRSHESLESSVQRLPDTEALLSIPTTRGPRQAPISSLPSPAALAAAERSRFQEIPTGSACSCCLHAGQAAPTEAPERYESPFRHLAAARQSPEVNSCSMVSERPQILAAAGGTTLDVPPESSARPRIARPAAARAAAAPAAAAEPVLQAFGGAAQPTVARERTRASRKAAPGARPRRRPQAAAPSAAEPVLAAFGSSAQPAVPRTRPPPASRKAIPNDAEVAAADAAGGSDIERYSRMGDIRVERYGRLAVAAPAAASAVGGGKVGGLTEEERRAAAVWLEERRARNKQRAREEASARRAEARATEEQLHQLASSHEVGSTPLEP